MKTRLILLVIILVSTDVYSIGLVDKDSISIDTLVNKAILSYVVPTDSIIAVPDEKTCLKKQNNSVIISTDTDSLQQSIPNLDNALQTPNNHHIDLQIKEQVYYNSELAFNDSTVIVEKKNMFSFKSRDCLKVAGLYTVSIILNAMGDGFNNSQRKTLGHMLNAASIGLLVLSPFIVKYDKSKWYWYLATYVSLRIGLFDLTYNTTRGLPLNFTGTTSPTDIVYNNSNINPNYVRSLFLSIGMSLPIAIL